jgi:hypothetical protein
MKIPLASAARLRYGALERQMERAPQGIDDALKHRRRQEIAHP